MCGHVFRFVLHKFQRPICFNCKMEEEMARQEGGKPEKRHASEYHGHFID